MDRTARDGRDGRDVLPRLTGRLDATGPRVSRAFDAVDAAQSLLPAHAQLPPPESHQHHPLHILPPLSASASFQTASSRHYFQHYADDRVQTYQPPYHLAASSNDSQDTTSSADTTVSTDTDRLFTPPISEGGLSASNSNGHSNGNAYAFEHDFSSQESQLMQLSELAAARARAPDTIDSPALSRKRTADGGVKHVRNMSNASPVFPGHSRNTSTVSVASTVGSRIGELSAELKAKLSYAMVKVNNGWQAHSIDQVENFASQATSPASSTSTIHGRHGTSTSPRLSVVTAHKRHSSQAAIGSWSSQSSTRSFNASPQLASPMAVLPSLAPPASIQPSRSLASARRNSNPGLLPSFAHRGQPSPVLRTPTTDPILFSPHQNVREQDAIETLLFMSSPGNSANMKRFPSTFSQPLTGGQYSDSEQAASPRHALPSAPRKSLPTSRPSHRHSQSLSSRRGHNRSPSEMDVDDSFGTPSSIGGTVRGTPRRRDNGYQATDMPTPRVKIPLSMPSGLSSTSKPRPVLGEDEIERMLDHAAAADDSSDSDSEILIPVRRRGQVGI